MLHSCTIYQPNAGVPYFFSKYPNTDIPGPAQSDPKTSIMQTERKQVTFADNLMVAPYCVNSTLGELHNGVAIYSFDETGETSGLGEGELIKLFSLFYNQEAAANEIFGEIEVGSHGANTRTHISFFITHVHAIKVIYGLICV